MLAEAEDKPGTGHNYEAASLKDPTMEHVSPCTIICIMTWRQANPWI